VRLPAEAKRFLQKLARALAKENKPVRWPTPAGFPFVNQYNKPLTKPVKLWLQKGVGTRVRRTIKTAVDELPKIDAHEAVKGIAPNFVHACDAAHLLLTVNAAVEEEIRLIATVHDCFACLPSQAERFRRIILEQFVKMYQEHDVLAEVLAEAQRDIGGQKLPPKPDPGELEIEEVLKAQFAFA
jgi:DNA-directed RNA polymerase, mitochondrial